MTGASSTTECLVDVSPRTVVCSSFRTTSKWREKSKVICFGVIMCACDVCVIRKLEITQERSKICLYFAKYSESKMGRANSAIHVTIASVTYHNIRCLTTENKSPAVAEKPRVTLYHTGNCNSPKSAPRQYYRHYI